MQFGPSTRKSDSPITATSRCCSALPSAPASPKPELKTTAVFAPIAAASATTAGTFCAGNATITCSGGAGQAPSDENAGTPCTSAYCGLIG